MQCFDTHQRSVFLFDYQGSLPKINDKIIFNNVEWVVTEVIPNSPTLIDTTEHFTLMQKWDKEHTITRLFVSYVKDIESSTI